VKFRSVVYASCSLQCLRQNDPLERTVRRRYAVSVHRLVPLMGDNRCERCLGSVEEL
jgi:hypothetical protein